MNYLNKSTLFYIFLLLLTPNSVFVLDFSLRPQQNHQNLPTLSQPKGSEWLWHPKVVGLYKLILQNSDYSTCSREAAIGALQNITAGDARVTPRPDRQL